MRPHSANYSGDRVVVIESGRPAEAAMELWLPASLLLALGDRFIFLLIS